MSSEIVYSPACPIPIEFSVEKRIRELKDGLNPESPYYARVGQHKNIRKLIELYENDKVPIGKTIYIMEGEVVERKKAMSSPYFVLTEVLSWNINWRTLLANKSEF